MRFNFSFIIKPFVSLVYVICSIQLNRDAPQLNWQVAGKHRPRGTLAGGGEGENEGSMERERAQYIQSSAKPRGGGRRGGGGGGAQLAGSGMASGVQGGGSGGGAGSGAEHRGGRSRGPRVNGGTKAAGGGGDGGVDGGTAAAAAAPASAQNSKRDQREHKIREKLGIGSGTGRPAAEKPAEPIQLGKRPSSVLYLPMTYSKLILYYNSIIQWL